MAEKKTIAIVAIVSILFIFILIIAYNNYSQPSQNTPNCVSTDTEICKLVQGKCECVPVMNLKPPITEDLDLPLENSNSKYTSSSASIDNCGSFSKRNRIGYFIINTLPFDLDLITYPFPPGASNCNNFTTSNLTPSIFVNLKGAKNYNVEYWKKGSYPFYSGQVLYAMGKRENSIIQQKPIPLPLADPFNDVIVLNVFLDENRQIGYATRLATYKEINRIINEKINPTNTPIRSN